MHRCTVDSCNEVTDQCDNLPSDSSCDDGAFCNGAETCDAVNDCQAGVAPNCDDGVGCTDDSCNEVTDSCDSVANDGNCDDGAFCNGAETCDAALDCQPGGDSCPGQSCDEASETCVACLVDADCDDGLFCNGAESCVAGACQAGTLSNCDDGVGCTDDSCNGVTDQCDSVANDGNCDDGAFCNGAETCDAALDCQTGTAVECDDGVGCTADSCNEATESCDSVANDGNCDDGAFCNGAETCDAALDCQPGGDPCPGESCSEATDTCGAGGPVQVSFTSNGAQDGWVRESSENSSLGDKSNTGGIQAGDDKKDRQYRSILSFDTSSIPNGAAILSATLQLRRTGLKGGNPFPGLGQCRVDIRTGGFGGSPDLVSGDFEAAPSAAVVTTLSNAPANGDLSEGGLNAAGLVAINKTGVTQFRVYFEFGDNDDSSDDYIKYSGGEDAIPGNRPTLIVLYQE